MGSAPRETPRRRAAFVRQESWQQVLVCLLVCVMSYSAFRILSYLSCISYYSVVFFCTCVSAPPRRARQSPAAAVQAVAPRGTRPPQRPMYVCTSIYLSLSLSLYIYIYIYIDVYIYIYIYTHVYVPRAARASSGRPRRAIPAILSTHAIGQYHACMSSV